MKHLVLLLLLCWLARPALAQIDTTGGKFYRPLYVPTGTANVQFGSAVNSGGTTQALRMDIYYPSNGPATPRPVVILAHGGFFIGGTRTEFAVSELCRRLASLGYVAASIDYRLESVFSYSGSRAVVNAVHDMRAAVRFFRQDAATTNTYNVDPLYIFAGGSSAGAVTAVHVAYLDQDAELAELNAPGVAAGLEGNSGNPGHSSAIVAAINLCGAIGDLDWLQPGDEPLVSLHGNLDTTVPYGVGATATGDVVYGSGVIKPRADAVGVPNTLYTFRGAGHVPYNGTSARQLAYMDTTFWTVRNFLRPLLAAASPLPVTLTSFEAVRVGNAALLRWTTAQEENSAGYEVEASADGHHFRRLGFVPSAAPHSTTQQHYSFRDTEPGKPAQRYYRLRQLDLDGSAHYYGPRLVRFAPTTALAAYPNPATETAAAWISTATSTTGQLELHDALGRVLSQQPLQLPAGQTQVPLPVLAGLPGGVYQLVLRCADGSVQQTRLLKR
jgi:acetyl esterase/lipase